MCRFWALGIWTGLDGTILFSGVLRSLGGIQLAEEQIWGAQDGFTLCLSPFWGCNTGLPESVPRARKRNLCPDTGLVHVPSPVGQSSHKGHPEPRGGDTDPPLNEKNVKKNMAIFNLPQPKQS